MSVDSVGSTRAPNGGSSDVDESASPATGKTPSGSTSVSEGKAPWTAERNETLKAQSDVLIEQATNGSGQFDIPGFEKGLEADEQALLDKAADLEAQGLSDAAWCLKLEALALIDTRSLAAAKNAYDLDAAGGDEFLGATSNGEDGGSDLGADVADAKAFAKQAFFESLPAAAESMSGEEFALMMTDFLVAVSSSAYADLSRADQRKMQHPLDFGLSVGQVNKLKSEMDAYVHNSANGNGDAAASNLLTMSLIAGLALEKGVGGADAKNADYVFGLPDQIKDLVETKFNGLVLEHPRVARSWVRERMIVIMEDFFKGGGNDPATIQTKIMQQAALEESVNDLYSIWQAAFQLAAR